MAHTKAIAQLFECSIGYVSLQLKNIYTAGELAAVNYREKLDSSQQPSKIQDELQPQNDDNEEI